MEATDMKFMEYAELHMAMLTEIILKKTHW